MGRAYPAFNQGRMSRKIFYRLPEDDDPPPDREPLLEDPLEDPEERPEEEDEPLYPDEEPELLTADDPLL
ncbi:MAG: hypothetical protein A2X22_10580 [Bacteroidetes bacterium GWF2_49_14]|nr:MAG: hypothetical protein A2X22_10580 [Bacteroidetes bacterium GWF2_49_14]HBB93019.1 hypothetical protein [Bacteroidales bacterium]